MKKILSNISLTVVMMASSSAIFRYDSPLSSWSISALLEGIIHQVPYRSLRLLHLSFPAEQGGQVAVHGSPEDTVLLISSPSGSVMSEIRFAVSIPLADGSEVTRR